MEKRNRKILVLKTSIGTRLDLLRADKLLSHHPQIINWHVDLEDYDKVLRIECCGLSEADIAEILKKAELKAERLQ